jgi:hypothetical protein
MGYGVMTLKRWWINACGLTLVDLRAEHILGDEDLWRKAGRVGGSGRERHWSWR